MHAYNNPIYIYIQHTHIKSTIEGARRATFARAIDARVRSEEFESFFRLFIQSTRGRAHAEDQSPSVVKITTPPQLSSTLTPFVRKIDDIEKYAADKQEGKLGG